MYTKLISNVTDLKCNTKMGDNVFFQLNQEKTPYSTIQKSERFWNTSTNQWLDITKVHNP